MTRADNTHHLKVAATERHIAAVARARAAIEELDRVGTAVTFAAVADAAGVSRGWLYTQPELRAAITGLRHIRTLTTPTRPAAQRATTDSLRARLDAARDEIQHLRTENANLHAQLARSLGDQRVHR